jgi:hypothetical protein
MKKVIVVLVLLLAFASPALSEIRSMDVTIFGMD